MRVRSLLALISVLAVLGLPAAALAQSAGDEQYVDPLGGGQTTGGGSQQGSGGGSSGSGGGTSQGSSGGSTGSSGGSVSSGAPAAPVTSPTTAAATGTAAASPAELARTGLDVRVVAALGGILLLAGGLALRRPRHGRR